MKSKRLLLPTRLLLSLFAVLCASVAWAQDHPNIGAITWNATGSNYEIGSEAALEDLAVYVNGAGTYSTGGQETTAHDCAGLTFKLSANISMTSPHTAIGTTPGNPNRGDFAPSTDAKPFKGTFDGGTFTITSLSINQPAADFQGLFGFAADGATIQNVTLNECNISGRACVGGIVGCTEGSETSKVTIQNCRVNGTVDCTTTSNDNYNAIESYHGGIVGYSYNYTDIANCTVTGSVSFSTKEQNSQSMANYYGGICGRVLKHTQISSCQTAVDVAGDNYCGGIVGAIDDDNSDNPVNSVSDCFSAGTVTVYSTAYYKNKGSLAGARYPRDDKYTSFSNCYYYTTGTLKAFGTDSGGSTDVSGRGERVYTITTGNHFSALTIDETPTYTSALTGQSYYKGASQQTAWTLNLTPSWTNGFFVKLTSNTGTITNPTTLDATHQLYYFSDNVIIDAEVYADFGAITWNNTDRCFEIASPEGLADLAVYVNGQGTYSTGESETTKHECAGMTFKLTQDIDMANVAFTTIGNSNHWFRGSFDGGNHTIKNLTVNNPLADNQGLFGYVLGDGFIKDVTLEACTIVGKESTGGIAAYVSGDTNATRRVIRNCHVVNGTIGATQSGANHHGGIVGYLYSLGTIDGCSVSGTISTTESCNDYGGIVGRIKQGSSGNNCTVSNCENAADIVGPGDYHGGIWGHDYSGSTLTGCLNTGNVEGTSSVGAIGGLTYVSSGLSNNYYASPCALINKPFGDWQEDWTGKGEHAYRITAGENVTGIESTGAVFTSHRDGLQVYFKPGDITLTLTADIPSGYNFVTYDCDGAQLSDATSATGTHTLTMPKQGLVVNARISNSNAADLSGADIAAIGEQRWKGTVAVAPATTVTLNGTTLTEGTDYTVVFTGNTPTAAELPATATATIQGINNYTGSVSATFQIADFPLQDSTNPNSATNTYQVADEADLQALACIVNSGARTNGYYQQTADITLTKEHTPIGRPDTNKQFQGSYNGDGKNITGLTISRPTTVNAPEYRYNGLFGYAKNATIEKVNIVDCNISGYYSTGGIVGDAYSGTTVKNCTVSGSIKGFGDLGGIVGYAYDAMITDNTNNAVIQANGNGQFAGGIVGYGYGQDGNKIENNTNHASVSGGRYAGGIISYLAGRSCYVNNNFNTGVVNGQEYVGSIIGSDNSQNPAIANNYYIAGSGMTGGVGAEGIDYGTDVEGKAEVVFTITAGDNVSIADPLPTATKEYNSQNYYKNGVEVTLNYTGPDFFNVYTVDNGEISNPAVIDGTHALTGVTDNVTVTGTNIAQKTDFSETVVIASIDDLTYNGSVQHPEPTVTIGQTTLVKNQDYSYSYSQGCQDIGTYTVTVTGLGAYTGTKSADFNILACDISNASVSGVDPFYNYTGQAIQPNPTVKSDATTLSNGSDYDIAYSNGCTETGEYTLTITGKGNYTGEQTVSFYIANGVTVYDSYSYSSYIPFNGSNADSYQKSEFIMTADRLTAMENQVIKGMNFYLKTTASKSWGDARFRVFMKEVEAGSFADDNFMGTEGAAIVYEGPLDGTQSKMFVEFTTPFVYHGGNLLIGIYEYQTGSWSGAYFYAATANSNASISGNSYNSLDAITGIRQSLVPKTTFFYELPASVDITMNSLGIMTYASPYALDFGNVTIGSEADASLKATYASAFITNSDETGELMLTDLTQVPEGEGLLLKGTAGTTYTVPVIASAQALAPENMMVGLTKATSVSKKQTINNEEYTTFILANGSNGINWYVLDEDSYTLKANSAYLRLRNDLIYNSNGNARQIVMNFSEATGISTQPTLNSRLLNDSWYTLDGVKLDKQPTRKGLYIRNGKLVTIK